MKIEVGDIDFTGFLSCYNEYLFVATSMVNDFAAMKDECANKRSVLVFCAEAFAFKKAIRISTAEFVKNGMLLGSDENSIKEVFLQDSSYLRTDVERIIAKNDALRTSFGKDTDFDRRIRELLLYHSLKYLKTLNGERVSLDEEKSNELNRRREQVLCCDNRYSERLNSAIDEAFQLVLRIIESDRGMDRMDVEIVDFLEVSITETLPFYAWFRCFEGLKSLRSLKKNTSNRMNALCRKCFRRLRRSNMQSLCKINENRSCFNSRYSNRLKGLNVVLEAKNVCKRCGALARLNHTYKVKGSYYQFCSKKCHEAYRKQLIRARTGIA